MRTARWRALSLLLAAIAGVWLGREFSGIRAELWFGGAVVCGLGLLGIRRQLAGLLVPMGLVLLMAGWTAGRVHAVAQDSLLVALPSDEPTALGGLPVRVRGVVTQAPELPSPADLERQPYLPFQQPQGKLALRLHAAEMGNGSRRSWEAVSGRLLVFAPPDAVEAWAIGDTIEARGLLSLPSGPMNPGDPDWLGLARQRGAVGTLRVPDGDLLIPGLGPTGALDRLRVWRDQTLGTMRHEVRWRLGLDGPPQSRGQAIMGALLLGVREDPNEPIPTAMRRLGLAHLMAISGFHLALAVGLVMVALRAVRDWGRLEPWMLAVIVLAYVAILPVKVPILRAALLVLGLLAGRAAGRRYDSFGVLCWIAIGLLVWRPLDAFALGYQLSVGITAVLLAQPPRRGVGVDQPASAIVESVALWPSRAVGVCIRCWAVGQPAVWAHTGLLSILGWLTTVLVVPVIVLLLAGGLATVLLSLVWVDGARMALGGLSSLAFWLAACVMWVDGLGWFWVQGRAVPWWLGVGLTVGVLGVMHRPRWVQRWAVLLVLLAVTLGVLHRTGGLGRDELLRLDTIAVGNGSCYLLRSGDAAMLFDAGSMRGENGVHDLPRTLRELGVTRIPTVVISHANLDHYNLLPQLIEPMGVQRVLTTVAFLRQGQERGPERDLLKQLEGFGVDVVVLRADETFVLGSARVEAWWPRAADGEPIDLLEGNDASLVLRLHVETESGPRGALMTGDIGPLPSEAMLAWPGELPRVDVLELPHHGSYHDEVAWLVRTLDPSVVLQSTGPDRLRETRWDPIRGGRTWRTTAMHGHTRVSMYRDGSLRVSSQRAGW